MLTLLRIGWTSIKRDRVAQALGFLLPIVFFTIFASVFSGDGDEGTPPVRIAVVDEDDSEFSQRLRAGLSREAALRVREAGPGEPPLDRAAAAELVRKGDLPVAVVLPQGLGGALQATGLGTSGLEVELLADPSDPIAPKMVQGLLQKVTMTAAPDLVMQAGLRQFEQFGGALTASQREAVQAWLPRLKAESGTESVTPASGTGGAMGIGVKVVDVMRTDDRAGSLISFFAAGVGVMFLLFAAVGGAGGALLEEAESGTLERLLSTNIGMTGLLLGKWLLLTLVGTAQLTVMFTWGQLIFGLPLTSHVPGFLVMTVVTAGAASALGLVLATAARSRAQLAALSPIIILSMSALGGSMFPRFLMSETMQRIGLLTFNGWALDGYLKVFWRQSPIIDLWPQVLVLSTLAVIFMVMARLLARRWEIA